MIDSLWELMWQAVLVNWSLHLTYCVWTFMHSPRPGTPVRWIHPTDGRAVLLGKVIRRTGYAVEIAIIGPQYAGLRLRVSRHELLTGPEITAACIAAKMGVYEA